MDYTEFKKRFLKLPLIVSRDAVQLEKDGQAMRNQLNRWQSRGLIVRLKKGIYILNRDDRKVDPSRVFLANRLYDPSYVSLEFALNFYGLIPERAADVTCITTKKTARFVNEFGTFIYQHIKPDTFRGFKLAKDEAGLPVFIAEPEKAVVDFIYLNLSKFAKPEKERFAQSFRFQNTEKLSEKKIMFYVGLFSNRKLLSAAKEFCVFIKESKR
ncbi:MAG: hypothetical protein KAQ99_10120 [Candidatus Aureabacteria bacterium]|nr:hypothetical protein [Candidatus Auribacterota bacterium]MCK5161918.1 hypothetical protein [Candidatus Auribacterota bacterium]